jgi:hypothetical protein
VESGTLQHALSTAEFRRTMHLNLLCTCFAVVPAPQCGFPVTPRLQLLLPDGVEVISIVWRDNLNRTVALDTTQVQLPPLAPLLEASVANTEQRNLGCDWSYHVSSEHSRHVHRVWRSCMATHASSGLWKLPCSITLAVQSHHVPCSAEHCNRY